MRIKTIAQRAFLAGASLLFISCAATAQQPSDLAGQRDIDAKQSFIRVRVFKTGFFSAFAHNHLIEAPLAEGAANLGDKPSVKLRIASSALRVLDPEAKPAERAEIEKTMKGPAVLDVAQFSEIQFESTAVTPLGDAAWNVRGNLTLHGVTRPVEFPVSLANGRYRGGVALRQRDFGVEPVSIAGGTVKVKNEVRIEFDIAFAPPALPTESAARP